MSEDEKIVEQFCVGLRKLFSTRSNWTYVMPLLFNVESCAMCQLCVDECPVYKATREEKLMPVYRSELFRRIVRDCLKGPRSVSSKKDEVYRSIEELYRLSYSCTLCRRCAQACPLGLDNSVITRELRKLFSQELGWAPKELHIDGTCLHLAKGSPTGMSSQILVKEVEFIVEDYSKTFGMELQCTWDMPEADILFIPSIGELFVEPENFISMIILLHIRGEAWTLPSSPPLYDGVNYGVFYDDIQLIRILSAHLKLIKN
ncbi:MAG: (Fe-S)-binding protein [candidate division WOR-3 bacterium]